jgi:hypothetical protein
VNAETWPDKFTPEQPLHQFVLHNPARKLSARLDVQSGKDPLGVRLDRALGDHQTFGNLFVGQPGSD